MTLDRSLAALFLVATLLISLPQLVCVFRFKIMEGFAERSFMGCLWVDKKTSYWTWQLASKEFLVYPSAFCFCRQTNVLVFKDFS